MVGRKKKNVKEREPVGKGRKKNEKDGWKEEEKCERKRARGQRRKKRMRKMVGRKKRNVKERELVGKGGKKE